MWSNRSGGTQHTNLVKEVSSFLGFARSFSVRGYGSLFTWPTLLPPPKIATTRVSRGSVGTIYGPSTI